MDMTKNDAVFPERDDPIIIMAMPRSGSSMVAGVFAAHGVFVGTCKEADSKNEKGFFEHVGFTKLVIELYGKGLISRNRTPEPHPDFKGRFMDLIKEDGYSGGPWLIKHAHVYHKIWKGFNPRFIVVKRDTASISESSRDLGWASSMSHIIEGQKMLDRIVKEHDAPVVDSNELIKGNYDSLEKAFKHCSLIFNKWTADDFIEPDLWRHSVEVPKEDTSVVMRDRSYVKPNLKKGQKHA
jgi:hypothetical protein